MTTAPVRSDEEIALSAIAHSLREPLQGVIGYLELIELGRYGEAGGDLRAPLARISANARTLSGRLELAMGLMALACDGPERGTGVATPSTGPAAQAIRRALEESSDPAIRIENRVDEGLPSVPGPTDRLVTLFLSMLRIALASPGSRHLLLHGEAGASGARFHVERVPDPTHETGFEAPPGKPVEEVELEVTVLNLLASSLRGRVEWPNGVGAGSIPVLQLPFAGEKP